MKYKVKLVHSFIYQFSKYLVGIYFEPRIGDITEKKAYKSPSTIELPYGWMKLILTTFITGILYFLIPFTFSFISSIPLSIWQLPICSLYL